MKLVFIVLVAVLFLGALPAQAQPCDPQSIQEGLNCVRNTIANPGGLFAGQSAAELIKKITLFILSVAGIIAVAVLIFGGLLYITSLGDEERAKRAKHLILYTIIGLLVIGLSAALVNFVIGAFG